MPPFTREDLGTFDWHLFQNGPVARFDDSAALTETARRLRDKGYRVEEFNCTSWANERAMHEELRSRLEFPELYGRNLDALNDCLRRLAFGDDLGIILVFRGFGALVKSDGFRPKTYWHLLDLIARHSRDHLLLGDRFFGIIELQAAPEEVAAFGSYHVNYPSHV